MARPADESLIGRTLAGKFVVESFIGGGAMGAVYRARQLSLDKSIAIKVLHGDLVSDPTFIARFEREAKAASRLDHPNSMRVLDYGRDDADGLCYIAMELLDGKSLFSILREARGPLPDKRTVDLLRQVLAALAVAHEMGVVHRDLKPENIIVLQSKSDDGNVIETVKVCDFGMAKVLADDRRPEDAGLEKLTSHGVIVGTPEYMSPEQGKGEELDVRSDLYAVGVILYQMLTGKLPFQADTPIATVLKHLVEEPKPPSQIIAGVNLGLEAVCLRALKKEREERFASAREMRTALRNAPTLGARAADPVRPSSPGSPLDSSRGPLTTGTRAALVAATHVRRRTAADALAAGDEPRRTPAVLAFAALAVLVMTIGGFIALRLKHASAAGADAERQAGTTSEPVPVAKVPNAASRAEPVAPAATGSSWTEPSPFVPTAGARTSTLAGGSKALPKSPIAPIEASSARTTPAVSAAPLPTASSPIAAPPPSESDASEPAPLPTPTPPPSDPFVQASVSFGAVRTTSAQASEVLGALPSGRFNQCYRDGLRARGSALGGSGTLHVGFGGNGHVTEATFAGPPDLAAIGQCVANSAIGSDVRNVEVGATGADVDLSFKPD